MEYCGSTFSWHLIKADSPAPNPSVRTCFLLSLLIANAVSFRAHLEKAETLLGIANNGDLMW